jgi:transcription initiation factor TFIID subunit 5
MYLLKCNVLLFVILYCTSAFSPVTIFSTTSMYATLVVSPGQPSLISDDADVVALIGTSKDLAKQINQKEVHWGVRYTSVGLFST